jgi:hypothetical protein
MPSVQTSYLDQAVSAVAGMIASSEPSTVISRICETAAGIGFGVVAVQGVGDDEVRVCEAGKAFRGITLMDKTVRPDNVDQYAQYDNVAVITKGPVWVLAGATVVAGEPALFVEATGALTNVVAAGNVAIDGAIFDTSAASGALCVLRLA